MLPQPEAEELHLRLLQPEVEEPRLRLHQPAAAELHFPRQARPGRPEAEEAQRRRCPYRFPEAEEPYHRSRPAEAVKQNHPLLLK